LDRVTFNQYRFWFLVECCCSNAASGLFISLLQAVLSTHMKLNTSRPDLSSKPLNFWMQVQGIRLI